MSLSFSYHGDYTYLILKNSKWTLAGIFADRGESGTTVEHRDDFNRMINEAKAGKIDLIITKSISRFSRNVVDVLETIKTLRELPSPVHCYFEKENIHTADDKSSIFITLMSSLAQNEITTLASSITWGIQKLAQSGTIHRTTDFYGYTIDKSRTWEVVPKEAEVIRWMAKEFQNKKSYNEIIKELHNKQINSPSGQDYWNDSQIREMLKNEKYKGDYLFQKSYTPDIIGSKSKTNNGKLAQYYIEKHHPVIIDEKEWDLIQDEMKRRARGTIKDAKIAQTAGRKCFYHKFSCAECGGVITRYSAMARCRDGSKWRCYSSYGTMNVECHNNVTVRQEYLELNFMKTLVDIGKQKKLMIEVEQEIEDLNLTKTDCIREKEIKEEIEMINQQLYVAVDNEIAKEGYETQKVEFLTSQIIKLQKELKVFIERAEKSKYYREELKKLLIICEAVEPINFRDFHHMDARIKSGDSIYNTTKVAKDSTYIKKNEPDNFLEDIFNKYITKAQINSEGSIIYNFIFGIDYGIKMTYKEYLNEFEKTKEEINLAELIISKEVMKLKEFCKEAKYPREMRDLVNIPSRMSFSRRILKPLVQAGKLKTIGENKGNDWRYYWDS